MFSCLTYDGVVCRQDVVVFFEQGASVTVLSLCYQVVLLCYHYFGVAELYVPARVIVAAYVWLSAFGNATYFLRAGHISLSRIISNTLRICMMPLIISATLGQPLMLYYVVPQAVLTLCLSAVFALAAQASPWRQHGTRIAIAVISIACLIIWDTPLHASVVSFLSNRWPLASPQAVALPAGHIGLNPLNVSHEWLFRTSLDHFAPIWGFMFAIFALRLTPALTSGWKWGSLLLIAVCAVPVWAVLVFPLPKLEFNSLHPYLSCIPIFSYVLLRNSTSTLRKHYSGLAAFIGRHTLELYIFQVRKNTC